MDTRKAKDDLGLLADSLAVMSAVVAAGIWLHRGEHWRVGVIVLGSAGWIYLVGGTVLAVRTARDSIRWTRLWRNNHYVVSAGLALFLLLVCLGGTLVAVRSTGTWSSPSYVGLVPALGAGIQGASALATRYR